MRKHFTRRRKLLAIGGVAALGLALLQAPSATALPADVFEIDGNALDNNPGTAVPNEGGDDWDTLYADTTGPAGASTAFTGIIADPPPDATTFTGGGSKDDLDVPSWRHVAGSNPDKAEILNAYAAAYLGPDSDDPGTESDLILYFGSDRYAVNGATNVGFWFTKQKIAPLAGGTFSGVHETGDTLVLSEFTIGGTTPGVQVWRWDPAGTGPTCPSTVTLDDVGCKDNDGTLKLTFFGAGTCAADACAITNGSGTTVPWPYDAKGGGNQQGSVPAGGFFGGGINLSRLSGGARPCLSNFVAETRSSPSTDAVLLDFVRGDFPLCGASVQIAGSDINEVGDPHTFTVTANEVFGGSSSPSNDAHVDVTLTSANGATPVINAAASTCDDAGVNVNASGQCTIVFTSATVGTVTGSATASVPVEGQTFVVTTNGQAGNSGTVVKRFVDAKITLSPLTDTNGITENHVVTADVEVNLGDGAGFVPAAVGHVDVTTVGTGGAVVTPNNSGTTCHVASPPDPAGSDNLDNDGRCTVAFTSNSAGTVTVNATVNLSVTVGGFTEAITRTTNGSGGNSVGATKEFKAGTITWVKHDDLGALLGGATFEVCRTHVWDSNAAAQVDISPDVCFTVADDVLTDTPDVTTPDADNDFGEFRLENLILGTYTIRETVAPAGYALDPDTETVVLNTTTTTGPTNIIFVDPALFKVIVFTCNTSTEQLVLSSVDESPLVNGGVKDTQAPGSLTAEQETFICGLEANYDNKPRGNHTYQVTIPKP